jgi:phosphoglycerol transferase MdoB-like AlkP superfamily enzyme
MKYSDNYVRQVVENISKQNNNTIFVILGDHGAREVNIQQNRPKGASFGDELFKTTAMIYSPLM